MNTMTTITVVSLTAFASFLLTAVLGRWLVPALHRLKFGQTIRDIGPAWHKNKQGTPTMGGIMFALGMVIALVAAILVCELFLPVKIFRGGRGKYCQYPDDYPADYRYSAGIVLRDDRFSRRLHQGGQEAQSWADRETEAVFAVGGGARIRLVAVYGRRYRGIYPGTR